MSFIKKNMSSSGSSPKSSPAMKTINYRGGVIEFRIPASWNEEYSDTDGGMFYDDKPDSGTFRLKVITAKSPSEVTSDSAATILKTLGLKGQAVLQPNGNALAHYEESSAESRQEIKIFYWLVANPLPPRHVRIATFSYTILQRKERDAATLWDLQMLEKEILKARFATEVGI